MIQFVLVFPLFACAIIVMVDLARVLAVKAILTKGAENGINLAVKIPNLDVDLRTLHPQEEDAINYKLAREIVLEHATNLPINTMLSPSNTTDSMQLVAYEYQDPTGTLATVPAPVEFDAALLRPGEQVLVKYGATPSYLQHKTFPPSASQSPATEDLLKTHPIIIELRATVKTYFPLFSDISVRGSAMGYREQIPRGPLTAYLQGTPAPQASTTTSSSTTTSTYTTTTMQALVCVPHWKLCLGKTVTDPQCPDIFDPVPGKCPCINCNGLIAY